MGRMTSPCFFCPPWRVDAGTGAKADRSKGLCGACRNENQGFWEWLEDLRPRVSEMYLVLRAA
jgi:hypothetical protein